jgi:hypothetical protein
MLERYKELCVDIIFYACLQAAKMRHNEYRVRQSLEKLNSADNSIFE